MPKVREASLEDAHQLAPRLRQEDKAEVLAATGLSPEVALPSAFFVSDRAWTITHDSGEVIGMFGVSPVLPDVGSPWLLASPELVKIQVPFLRQSKAWVEEMHRDYPLLVNFVDARNTVHIRWLRWCGFIFINRHEHYGHAGIPFYEFVKLRKLA